MADLMPKQRPEYLHRERTRHKTFVWYYRVPGGKRIRIRGEYGTPEFWSNVEKARAGGAPSRSGHGRLSLAWCIEQLMASAGWKALASESRKQLSYQFERVKANAGKELITSIRRKDVLASRDKRRSVPSDANKYLRAMTMLCRFAVDQEWIPASPVHDIAKLPTSKTGEGFYTWKKDDLSAFESRWPLGTYQRLAYEIIVCTGLRRGDVHKFGKQHIKNGVYSVRTSKTGMVVESAVPPRLAHAIASTPTGDLFFITRDGVHPFKSKESFGNWFGDACKAAGVPGSAHGIRKGIASLAAEGGMTEAELNSFFGWSHGSGESATYIKKASRAKMARKVGASVVRTLKGAGEKAAQPIDKKGK